MIVVVAGRLLRDLFALFLALVLSLMLFLLLPVMQKIASPPDKDLEVRTVSLAGLEPPPPPPVQEEPEPQEQEQKTPELAEEAPPLDLSQLELALNPGFGEGMGGDFHVKLVTAPGQGGSDGNDEIFSLADLDQKPRVVYQPAPSYPPELKKKR